MAVVSELAQWAPRPPARLLALTQPETLSEAKRAEARRRLNIITPALQQMQRAGMKRGAAVRWLFERTGKPSISTLDRWLSDYLHDPRLEALAPKHCRPRHPYGWEVRAWQLFNMPTQPTRSTVADWLVMEGFKGVTHSRVNSFLKALPKDITEASIARNGRDFHRDNLTSFKDRDYDDVAPGEAWVSDGHSMKVFCRDSVTGHAYRAELTPVLDVKSNLLIAWWWSHAESAETTVYAFCSALRACGNVPVWFYTDNGSGFKNERVSAMLQQLGVRPIHGLPRHKRGRAFGERFHGLVDRKFCARYVGAFSGFRTDEGLERMRRRIETGELFAPYDRQLQADFVQWAAWYNANPQQGKLAGRAPNDYKPEWHQNPLHIQPEELLRPWVRPEDPPTVRRSTVRFENRHYASDLLAPFEKLKVRVQYDRYDESVVWAYDTDGHYIGEIPLRKKVRFVAESVAADDRERSRLAANARQQAKIDRNNDLHCRVIAPAHVMDTLALPAPTAVPSITAQILDQGQSVTIPERPVRRVVRSVDPSSLAHLRAEIAAEQQAAPEETPAERFARACHLLRRQDAGHALGDEDARWLSIYRSSTEFSSRWALAEEFGFPAEPAATDEKAGIAPASVTDVAASVDPTARGPLTE